MNMGMKVEVEKGRVVIGEGFAISFQRTLRIPDDGNAYPLPPTLGGFPVRRGQDYADRLPAGWLGAEGTAVVFIPMYQREALWLAFEARSWKPNAVKIGAGGIDALTGEPWQEGLHGSPQDYLVCPNQPWLDGINAGNGEIRQFVAMPPGEGYTIEEQLSGIEEMGGLQVVAYDPLAGIFPDQPPPETGYSPEPLQLADSIQGMGVAAGGRIIQKIYPDPHGVEVWDQTNPGRLRVFIVNSLQLKLITGEPPPPTPVSARTYTERGYPWFALYDEARTDIPAADKLRGVKSVRELDDEQGRQLEDEEEPTPIDPSKIKGIDLEDS